MPKVTIHIDPNTCISAANCVGAAPQFFFIGSSCAEILDSSGASKGTSHTFEATREQMDLLEEAADSCPTRAITIATEA